jgi:hypothetical protein
MPDTVNLDRPWWVIEGYVVAAGAYTVVGVDGTCKIVVTTHGKARLLEPAEGVEPTASSAAL